MSQIEWFKNRFKDISGIWINEKNGSVFTTVKLKNGTTATVSHTLDVSAVNELGMLWAYVKAVESAVKCSLASAPTSPATYKELRAAGWTIDEIRKSKSYGHLYSAPPAALASRTDFF